MAAKIVISGSLGYLTLGEVVAGFVVLSLLAALGLAVRFRAKARARELDQVKLLERERLARDLHDTVAHHVSAMAIRAQAGLATLAYQPGAAEDRKRPARGRARAAATPRRVPSGHPHARPGRHPGHARVGRSHRRRPAGGGGHHDLRSGRLCVRSAACRRAGVPAQGRRSRVC
jgi:hypothetical protein